MKLWPYRKGARKDGFRIPALCSLAPLPRPAPVSSPAWNLLDASVDSLAMLVPPPVGGFGAAFRSARHTGGRAQGMPAGFAPGPVRSLAPPSTETIRSAPVDPPVGPAVRGCAPLPRPGIGNRPARIAAAPIRSACLLAASRPRRQARRNTVLLSGAAIKDRSARLARMPHWRRAVDPAGLGASERLDYLREAELLRGVPPESGELLAVFRMVPVELVSCIRYLAQHGILVYTIARPAGLKRTRLHDLAAVRNRDNGNIHLVAHRTRYRTAFLA